MTPKPAGAGERGGLVPPEPAASGALGGGKHPQSQTPLARSQSSRTGWAARPRVCDAQRPRLTAPRARPQLPGLRRAPGRWARCRRPAPLPPTVSGHRSPSGRQTPGSLQRLHHTPRRWLRGDASLRHPTLGAPPRQHPRPIGAAARSSPCGSRPRNAFPATPRGARRRWVVCAANLG